VIEITIGERTFQATPLFFSEYKRAAGILADMRRDALAADIPRVVASYEALLEILCVAVCRAGSQVALEETSELLTPAQIMESVGFLMQQSSIGNASAVGKPN